MKRRRANVLFVLVLVAGCALFLAATTKAEAMLYTFVLAFMGLCGYVYLLGQVRQRERLQPPAPVLRPVPEAGAPPRQAQRASADASRSAGPRRPTPSDVRASTDTVRQLTLRRRMPRRYTREAAGL